MVEVIPVFEDVEQRKIEEKARAIVQDEMNKQKEEAEMIVQKEKNVRKEREQSDNLSNKVNRIRERMEQQNKEVVKSTAVKQVNKPVDKPVDKHVPSANELCPTCHQHELAIDGNTALCQGEDCNSSFLLLERFKKDKPVERKDYMCATCGYSMTKKEAVELKDKDKTCPLCGEDQTVLVDVDWENINKNLKKFNKDRK